MKILHTSDWHLGCRLYGRTRYRESAAFLDWLATRIEHNAIDALLVAGDVFHTATPSNRAQELYYRFLYRVANSTCNDVIVIGGNHDSPTFLNAPQKLLQALNVHVVGAMTDLPEKECIPLHDNDNNVTAIVCAVPYLRDRDIRTVTPGESTEEKSRHLVNGICNHYKKICALAVSMQQEYGEIPLIAMGHLFTSGGTTIAGDGCRELYVGSLGQVGAAEFPDSIDYLALGHLHVPQQVGSTPHFWYSGSPLPMGFGEAKQQKMVVEVKFCRKKPKVDQIPVPCFQELEQVAGELEEILDRLGQLQKQQSSCWLEIEYTGRESIGNLREQIEEAVAGSSMEIRRIRNRTAVARALQPLAPDETLDDLDVDEVFNRCLESYGVAEEEREPLQHAHQEILRTLQEEDSNAE